MRGELLAAPDEVGAKRSVGAVAESSAGARDERFAWRATRCAGRSRRKKQVSQFVDEVQLNVRGGDGGAGCMSFRREAHVPQGGPDGGDGGKGGDIWMQANRNMASLLSFRDHPHRKAASGVHGQGQKRHGKNGEDLIIEVPEGPVVRDNDGEILADLVHHGDRWLAGRGGRGGRGNARFMSNKRRAPHFAEQGEFGEELWLRLELKLMADAALVGFPNAGKSTLISVISAAKPKIADYPFTTLEPNLGVVKYQEHEFVVADIPGLIDGAAEGRGLGHKFLRHVERARVLVILVDLAPVDGRSPDEQIDVLLGELGAYRPELLERPRVIVGSKNDVSMFDDTEFDGLRISAATRKGLDPLLAQLAQLVEHARNAQVDVETFAVLRPLDEGITVVQEGPREWRVVGRLAERAVALSDLTQPDAMIYVQQRLRKLGVDRILERSGVADGDVVRIGQMEFEYDGDLM